MVQLRRFQQSDIEDYVRWFTVDTEWFNWDAPWEQEVMQPGLVRENWTLYYERHRQYTADTVCYRFEIEDERKNHIGWVSAYTIDEFLDRFDTKQKMLAIGIDIPDVSYRKKGYGSLALRCFMAYFAGRGVKTIYIQTWSGNVGMVRTAEKLGFSVCNRIVGVRTVKGKKYDALTFQKAL
jgi:RimJ/RimL family protein N-acetyltransferase